MNILLLILREIFLLFSNYGAMIVYMMNVPRVLHYMQLENYNSSDFIRWMTKNPKLAFKAGFKQLALTCGFYIFITLINFIMLNKVYVEEFITLLFVEHFAMFFVFIIANIVQAFRDKKKRCSLEFTSPFKNFSLCHSGK